MVTKTGQQAQAPAKGAVEGRVMRSVTKSAAEKGAGFRRTATTGPTNPRGMRSKVTVRGQTTLPSGIRKVLDLEAGAEIQYEVRGDHVVLRKAVETVGEDPAVGSFLDFLERDMVAHPERLTPVTESLVARLRRLTEGVEVGKNERIEGPVAL